MGIVTSLTNGLSEREANDALNAHVSVISFRDKKSCLDGRIRGPLYPRRSLSEGAGVQAGSKAQRPGRYEEAGERSPLCARCSQPIEDSRSYYSEKTKQPRGFNPGLIPFLEADPQCGFLLKSGWVRLPACACCAQEHPCRSLAPGVCCWCLRFSCIFVLLCCSDQLLPGLQTARALERAGSAFLLRDGAFISNSADSENACQQAADVTV